jgi:hypothetical protein
MKYILTRESLIAKLGNVKSLDNWTPLSIIEDYLAYHSANYTEILVQDMTNSDMDGTYLVDPGLSIDIEWFDHLKSGESIRFRYSSKNEYPDGLTMYQGVDAIEINGTVYPCKIDIEPEYFEMDIDASIVVEPIEELVKLRGFLSFKTV